MVDSVDDGIQAGDDTCFIAEMGESLGVFGDFGENSDLELRTDLGHDLVVQVEAGAELVGCKHWESSLQSVAGLLCSHNDDSVGRNVWALVVDPG